MYADKKKMTLWFNDFVLEEEEIIFSSESFNGLFCGNIKTGKCSLAGVFPNENIYDYNLHYGTYRYKNRILFIPAFGKNFTVYDIDTHTFQIILSKADACVDGYKYFASAMVGKYVYVFGAFLPEIIRIDMEELKIRYYNGWQERLSEFGVREDNPFFYRDICHIGDHLYVVTGQNNSIVELDLKTDEILIHPTARGKDIYCTISYDGKYFWLTEGTRGFVRVDPSDWSCIYRKINNKVKASFFPSSKVVDGRVWLFSNRLENIFRVNCCDMSVEELKVVFDEADEWFPNSKGFGYGIVKKIEEDKLAVFCVEDCRLHIFRHDQEIENVRFYTTECVDLFYGHNMRRKFRQNFFAEEEDKLYCRFEDYIYLCKHLEEIDYRENRICSGENVYIFIKKECNNG